MDGILLVGNGLAQEHVQAEMLKLVTDIKENTDVSVVHVADWQQMDPSKVVLDFVKEGVTGLLVIAWRLQEASLAAVSETISAEVESFRGMRMRLVEYTAAKEDAMKQDVPKQDVPKQDVPKQDVPKQDVPKQDVLKPDALNEEAARLLQFVHGCLAEAVLDEKST